MIMLSVILNTAVYTVMSLQQIQRDTSAARLKDVVINLTGHKKLSGVKGI